MASPVRPVLRRQNSKVRFSRRDMSPIGTMASDSTIHGPHHRTQQQQLEEAEAEQHQLYDTSSYSYSAEEELEAPVSESAEYYDGLAGEEDDASLHPHDSESQRYVDDYEESARVYTSTPPRVGARRWSNAPQGRPTIDPFPASHGRDNANYSNMSVSPRGSTIMDGYSAPSTPPQNRSPYQNRPASALRTSLVVPSSGPSSPQRAINSRSDNRKT